MSHGGGSSSDGAGQPSCTSVSLGKYIRRALRAASGRKRIKDKPRKKSKGPAAATDSGVAVSMELMGSFSAEAGTVRRDSVVRVVLRSGVVEVYPGVVLACTVIRKHPPGLCLAHPDVFRNPHGALLRPLEPLFPGQKFLLLPESTVVKLKQKIPESSISAFSDDDDEEEEESEGATSTEASSEDYNSGGGAASSEEDRDNGVFMDGSSAREYYVVKDRWSECHFENLVVRGLAVEQCTDRPERKDKAKRKGKKKRTKGKKKRRDHQRVAVPAEPRTSATPRRRTWEPSLPSVEEETISPLHPPPEPRADDHEH